MDRNSIIGLVLIIAIMIGSGLYFQPSAEEIAAQKKQADSLALAESKKTPQTSPAIKPIAQSDIASTDSANVDSAILAKQNALLEAKFGAFAQAAQGNEQIHTLETDKLIINFSNKGGQIVDVIAKGYTDFKGKPVHLFDPENSKLGLDIPLNNIGTVNSSSLFFSPITPNAKISGEGKTAVVYRLNAGPDKYLEIIYNIKANDYLIDYQINTRGLDGVVDNSKKLQINWSALGLSNEKSVTIERQRSSVFFKAVDEDRDYLSETSEKEEESPEERLQWVAFKQYFFSAAISSTGGFDAGNNKLVVETPSDSAYTKKFLAQLNVPMANPANGSAALQLYFGPNTLDNLQATQIDQFDRIIDYGWGIFGLVNKYFIFYLFKYLNLTGVSIGISILLLTIAIKMLLMPLTYKNYQSSAKMKILKPEIDAINEKFKSADPMKKQQEMMALYKKTGVNPLAGCIPVLIQMPFLYAMFRFFPASIELRQQSFLWADDLSSYDSILDLGFNIPMYGDHISLFTILMCASTFIYTRMNSANMPAPQPGMPDMRMIMYIFPFMMLFFFNNFSSGLSWYYFAANLVTMLQTLVIRKYFVNEAKILAVIEENKSKPAGKSRIQRKMEEMASKRGIKLPK